MYISFWRVSLIRPQRVNAAISELLFHSVPLNQGSSNHSLESQSAAEFSSNPDQTHLPVIFYDLEDSD